MSEEATTNQEAAAPVEVVDTFDYGDSSKGVEEVNEVTESNDDSETEESSANEEPTEDSEELDVDGFKISLPKSKAEKLKAERMMNADYTRKTQEVAEQRKAFEAQREETMRVQEETLNERATLIAVNQRLQQFDKVNWAQLNAEDPVTAQSLWIERTQLVEAQNALGTNISKKEQQIAREKEQKASEAQQSTAKQVRECFDVVARDIKGWSPELARSLDKTANEFGFTNAELAQVKDPRFVKLLHKAHIADQLLKKQASSLPKPQLKPVPQVGGNSAPVKKRAEEMSMAEYVKMRRAQRK